MSVCTVVQFFNLSDVMAEGIASVGLHHRLDGHEFGVGWRH